MTEMLIFGVVALILLLVLLWLAREVHSPRPLAQGSQAPIEDLRALHCRYFRQVSQALSHSDEDYLRMRAGSSAVRRRVFAERRAVVRHYLAGLREDFRRLDRLSRTIAALSPEVSPFHERQRLWLALRCTGLFWTVRARLAFHSIPLDVLRDLADMIGGQAVQIEAAISRLNELSLLGSDASSA